MQTVTVRRTVAADAAAVRAAMADLEAFMAAGGFSSVAVDGDEVRLRQELGLGRIELRLEVVDDPDAALLLVQREGIFETMETRYEVEPAGEGATAVVATTTFTLGGIVGSVLDGTIVRRKRRQELGAQFDWLEAQVAAD